VSRRVRDILMAELGQLRYEPTAKRVRAVLGEHTAVDSRRAMLVWEPRRVVPSCAVPEADVQGYITVIAADSEQASRDSIGLRMPQLSERPILDPSIPFAVHTADGEAIRIRAGDRTAEGFRLADSELADFVVLDFAGFDEWYDEDEQIAGHPRDPFHRIDVLPSSRHVRLELDGQLLAESTRPRVLFETMLPPRYYLPREDIRAELRASSTQTYCAYKGSAAYWSPVLGDEIVDDLAWSYQAPLHDAAEVGGLVAFFDERVDLILDGVPQDRPLTPWSPRARAKSHG